MAMNISPNGTSQNPRQTPLTEAGSMSPKRWKFSISGLCPSTASCLFLISSWESGWWVRDAADRKGTQEGSRCYSEKWTGKGLHCHFANFGA